RNRSRRQARNRDAGRGPVDGVPVGVVEGLDVPAFHAAAGAARLTAVAGRGGDRRRAARRRRRRGRRGGRAVGRRGGRTARRSWRRGRGRGATGRPGHVVDVLVDVAGAVAVTVDAELQVDGLAGVGAHVVGALRPDLGVAGFLHVVVKDGAGTVDQVEALAGVGRAG